MPIPGVLRRSRSPDARSVTTEPFETAAICLPWRATRLGAPDPESALPPDIPPASDPHSGTPGPLRPAGLRRRLASLVYDAILLTPVLFITAYVFLALTQGAQTPLLYALFRLWLVAVLGVYFVYCWRRSGQTLAMKTWHIRVARKDGSPLSTTEALARYLLALWSVLLLGAGFLWALVDRERQFLHDRLVGSRLFHEARDTTQREEGRGKGEE
jgi:uncharacterized RDD family membrane protein YckC